jgi:Protein of unknown function (DUF3108)
MIRAAHVKNRALLLALVASVITHAAVYLATPRWTEGFQPIKAVKYDATLMPLVATALPPAAVAKTPRKSAAPKLAPKPVVAASPAAPSEANFTAPDNAIAVASGATDTVSNSAPPPETIAAAEPLIEDSTPKADRAPAPEVVADAAPATPTASSVPPSKRALPAFAERISIEYKLTSAITDGVANFKWTRKGSAYEIESSTEATGFLVGAFAGIIHQQSRGEITEDGLRPSYFSLRRGDGEADIAEFERATNSLKLQRRKDSRVLPLNREMQDMQSFLFQLAVDAPNLTEGQRLDVLVTNARKVYRHQFKKVGVETIDTRIGKIGTIHLLSEAANPEDTYEVWLAPQYFYLPIKLKLYVGKFPVVQIATRIGISGASGEKDLLATDKRR